MCGIVGMIGQRNTVPILLHGLHKLEYRGYDSAGLAVINQANGNLLHIKKTGKVNELEKALQIQTNITGNIGIAHTRWATHGRPTENNAHPHIISNRVAIVHNGIIENYKEIRHELKLSDSDLKSDTDTEIVVALIYSKLLDKQSNNNLLQAVMASARELEGAFAIAVLDRYNPDRMIAMRKGSPLVIGLGIEENFIASDPLALQKVTQDFIYLEEGDVAEVFVNQVHIYDNSGKQITREIKNTQLDFEAQDKGEYRHYMIKEIFEQPKAIKNTLQGRITTGNIVEEAFGNNTKAIFDQVKLVQIVACGTSYHAAMVGRNWLEELAGIPCQVEIASEFRYRSRVSQPNTLFITVSQSGETADTLAALRDIKQEQKNGNTNYIASLTISNMPESSLVRESDLCFLTHAGPEIGVATTKGFTSQLIGLYLLTIALGKRTKINPEKINYLLSEVENIADNMQEYLKLESTIKNLSELFSDKKHTLFLGRGSLFPIALEGALKLKEISYIHAEGYPAGELKHGPLALVDKDMPVVVLVPNNELLSKLKSNIQEVHARGGKLIIFAPKSANIQAEKNIEVIIVPEVPAELTPILFSIPMQLLSYYVAVLKGTDIDQPRNLAKSVTVE
jgi:glutamine---fructose-6-phosphate transaminase (isomerizing)